MERLETELREHHAKLARVGRSILRRAVGIGAYLDFETTIDHIIRQYLEFVVCRGRPDIKGSRHVAARNSDHGLGGGWARRPQSETESARLRRQPEDGARSQPHPLSGTGEVLRIVGSLQFDPHRLAAARGG